MYTLRRLIRGAEVDVEAKVSAVEDSLGTDLKSVLDEALQSKAPEDGQNLLTYAAAQGKEAWFLHIASQIRSKVREMFLHAIVESSAPKMLLWFVLCRSGKGSSSKAYYYQGRL